MLNFLLYFSVVIAFWAVAIAVYMRLTPYPEFELVRQGNMAATASLIGTVLGLALPLASLAAHAVNIVDLALWAGVALVVQLLCWRWRRSRCLLRSLLFQLGPGVRLRRCYQFAASGPHSCHRSAELHCQRKPGLPVGQGQVRTSGGRGMFSSGGG